MKLSFKSLTLLCTLLISFISQNSQASINDINEITLEFNNGYRQDHLQWSIQGYKGEPNILSELTFKDIQIYQIELEGRIVTCDNIYSRGSVSYGWILDGEIQDSDYDGNNRTLEFSRSYEKNYGDYVFDASIGVGYFFDICDSGFSIAPLAGYSHNEQHLRMTDGKQVFFTHEEFIGAIDGLNSTYRARWDSGWLGADFGYQTLGNLFLYTNYEFHWTTFHAKGHWNLRDDIGDFEHRSNGGFGNVVTSGLKYTYCDHWIIGLKGNYQYWKSHKGIDVMPFYEYEEILYGKTRLNPVIWHSFSIMASLGYKF